ncbi:MAG: XRE family transcriptional regulator [Gammaproteobacteria bacterium]|nr:XRE family transcriptional regulator [Gammaproteobacteria bacterium]
MAIEKKESCGNVFRDMGFSEREADNLKLRAELMIEIEKYIKKNKLTQTEAAKRFKIDQPRLNKLLKGHIELFTIDKLVSLLSNVDIKITFVRDEKKAA